jgi:hypothetical protein
MGPGVRRDDGVLENSLAAAGISWE